MGAASAKPYGHNPGEFGYIWSDEYKTETAAAKKAPIGSDIATPLASGLTPASLSADGRLSGLKANTGDSPEKAAAKAMQPLDMADIVLRAAGKVKTTTGYAGSFLTGPAENPVDRAARKFSQEKLILDAAKLRGLK